MANNVPNVNKWERDIAPSHYVLSIESFSKLTIMLLESECQYFKSKTFNASGYKWSLLVYPNGDGNMNSRGYISVLLCIEDADALPKPWGIYTDLKFFIYDQVRDKYSVFQVSGACRFHRLKTEWGIAKLVSRTLFDDAVNGYLVNDKCVFGVEVSVLDYKFEEEFLSLSVTDGKTFTWKVSDYSNLGSEVYSDEFSVNSFKWLLSLYPLGNQNSDQGNLSLFLQLVDEKISCTKLFVNFMLCIRSQKSEGHLKRQTCGFFTPKSSWGWGKFALLTDLKKVSKGFVDRNCIIVEAHIKNVYTINS